MRLRLCSERNYHSTPLDINLHSVLHLHICREVRDVYIRQWFGHVCFFITVCPLEL